VKEASLIQILALLFLSCHAGQAEEAPIPHFRMQEIETGLKVGYAVLLVDLNADGKKDIVVVDAHRVVWYENPSWQRRAIIEGQTRPENVCIDACDIDGDGQRDIIVFSGNKIWAINAAGAVLDNFPITVNTEKTILTSPIVADLDGNGTVDIVAVTQEGLVVAYDKTGKMVRGFPLLTGPNGGSTPAAFTFTVSPRGVAGIGLAVASDDGHVYAWQTGTLGPLPTDGIPDWNAPWPQYMHDAQNTGLVEDVLTYQPISSNFFPSSRAYNWPNPVGAEQNYKTYIRYYVRENAKVTIKIFDMAGDLVAELPGPGIGGFDNEVEWDVSNIQSGVYFGHIDAQGTSGSGSTVIKIAVIK